MESRLIWHYNYINWPDHGIPYSTEPLLDLIERLHLNPVYTSPVLVHCSAGVGRTGTFCVIDTILKLVTSGHAFLRDPILDITLMFRSQRISIVETYVQLLSYHVIYSAL